MSDNRLKFQAREYLTAYLTERGMRCTPERYAILDRIFDFPGLFTLDELMALLEKNSYHVSRATLYNTMALLADASMVRKHHFDGKPLCFERINPSAQANHLHQVCRLCGKIRELKVPDIALVTAGRSAAAFHAEYFVLYVYGVCSYCQRKLRRKRSDDSA